MYHKSLLCLIKNDIVFTQPKIHETVWRIMVSDVNMPYFWNVEILKKLTGKRYREEKRVFDHVFVHMKLNKA